MNAPHPGSDGSAPSAPSGPAAPAALALSVILCVHDGARTIGRQLDALVAQQWDQPWEIIVVDDHSTDASRSIAESYTSRGPGVRVLDAGAGTGLSHARNVGVEHAGGRAVAFCDDDDIVGDGWVAAIGTALADHPLVASRMAYEQLNDAPERYGRHDFQSTGIEQVFGRPVVHGAGAGWDRALWLRLGGNDVGIDFTGEDHDMVFRAFDTEGVEPWFCADAVYHYARRRGVRATFRQARRYGVGSAYLLQRYGPSRREPVAWRVVIARWLWLVVHLGDLRRPERATAWAWRAGQRVGRLQGSVRFRVLLL